MREIVGKGHPPVLRLLQYRPRRAGEAALSKGADSDTDIVGSQIGLPEHRRPAGRAKMVSDLSSFRGVTDISFVRSFGANMLFPEVRADAEHRAGPPLTFAAVAGDDGVGLVGHFDPQGATRAMRGSGHGL